MNVFKLIELIKENPELPIMPWVDSEIVADDGYSRWLGSFGDAWVGECAVYKDSYYDYRYFDDREEFKENYYDWNDDELYEKFHYNPVINKYTVKNGSFTQEELDENNKREKLLDEYLDSVADEYFKKVIFVYIDMPNDDWR